MIKVYIDTTMKIVTYFKKLTSIFPHDFISRLTIRFKQKYGQIP